MMEVKIDGTWTPSHVGLIVRDLDRSVQHYESLGFVFAPQVDRDSSQIADYLVHGQRRPTEKWSLRIATVGPYRIELVCPTGGDSLFEERLREKGEGIHHVAFAVPDLLAERARLTGMGITELMRFIRADGTGASFFDLKNNGSLIVELVQMEPPKK
jgi:catechol 2,3-dioxygenase-like lactoylglutathione lyase family enzyme